jgi:hypothetical protein
MESHAGDMASRSEVEQAVAKEMEHFRAALPELLASRRGEWVVFKDGRAQSFHADEDVALSWAITQYGVDGGFVVAPVEEERVVLLHSAAFFHPAA